MAIQFLKLFQPVQLPTISGLIFTVPASPLTNLLGNGQVILTNTTGAPIAVTLYAVPASGTASSVNEFFPSVSIAGNSSVSVNLPQMAAGDALYGLAGSATSVSIAALGGVFQS